MNPTCLALYRDCMGMIFQRMESVDADAQLDGWRVFLTFDAVVAS